MKIFLDTASINELKEGVALGVVDGVTTNPSLIAKEKRPFRPLVEEICSIVPGDVSRDICEIYRVQGFKTRVLAASIRNPLHVVDAAKAGAHVATMPFAVLEQLAKHPLTDIGLKKFLDDWAKLGEKI